MLKSLVLAAGLTALAGFALAQNHDHHGGGKSGDAPSTTAFKAANEPMHKGMAIAFTGNADRDFATGMIPHHQGAIDMAQVVLAHGKDPELRKLAQDIVKAQESEIAFMKAWLAKQPKN